MRLPFFGKALATAFLLGSCDGTEGDVLTPRAPTVAARLLSAGRDAPVGAGELAELRARIGTVEEGTPFDGIVLDLGFSRDLTRTTALDPAAHERAAEEVRATPFRKLTHNLQRISLGMRSVNWFDDAGFAIVVQNFERAASLTARAGLRGFFIDNQFYGPSARLWSYPALTAAMAAAGGAVPSFADAEAMVTTRAEMIMRAILMVLPSPTLLLSFGTSEVFRLVCIEGQDLETHDYGLYPAFLAGLERGAARAGTPLVDAYLPAYPTRDPAAFDVYYNLIHFRWDALVAAWRPGIVTHWDANVGSAKTLAWRTTPPARLPCDGSMLSRLARERPAGFGLMLDYDLVASRTFQADPALWEQNHFSPQRLEEVLTAALRRTDGYVWLWSETLSFWGLRGSSKPTAPPPTAYLDAIVRARQAALAGKTSTTP